MRSEIYRIILLTYYKKHRAIEIEVDEMVLRVSSDADTYSRVIFRRRLITYSLWYFENRLVRSSVYPLSITPSPLVCAVSVCTMSSVRLPTALR